MIIFSLKDLLNPFVSSSAIETSVHDYFWPERLLNPFVISSAIETSVQDYFSPEGPTQSVRDYFLP